MAKAKSNKPQAQNGDLRHLPKALAPLVKLPHWVLWRFEKKGDDWTKVPKQPDGSNASNDNPATWSNYKDVIAVADKFDGIGFCLLGTDFAAFDIDKCRSSDVHPWASELVAKCGSYTEVTPSGTGLRIIGYGTGPEVHRKQPVIDGVSLETYRKATRYITITGNQLPNTQQQLANIDAHIDAVVAELDEPKKKKKKRKAGSKRELPPNLRLMLHVPDPGKGNPPTPDYASRSQLFWYFINEALRQSVDEETIVEAVLDPAHAGHAIYAHAMDNDGEDHVRRQLARAANAIADDANKLLAEFNAKYCVVKLSGKTRVMSFSNVPRLHGGTRRLPEFQSASDFRLYHDNKTLLVGQKPVGHGTWWLYHVDRRQFEGVIFRPDAGPVVDNYFNLWTGWGIEPHLGDWSLMREHIHTVLVNGDKDCAAYFINWIAWALQHPTEQAEVAIVLRGPRGVGKGILGRGLCTMAGQHGLHISSHGQLAGKFNAHLMDCVFLFADEAFWPGDRSATGTLKRIITENTLVIERKGYDVIVRENMLHILMATNEEWVVPAGMDERRFACFNTVKEKPNKDYFTKLYAEVDNGGLAAMMHELMNKDLGNWHPRDDVPQTAALLEQKIHSLNSEEAWWYDILQRGELPWGTDENNSCPSKRLFNNYTRYAGRQYSRASQTTIGMFLNKHVPGLDHKQASYKIISNKQGDVKPVDGYVYFFPSLAECRKAFSKHMRQPITWQPGATTWNKEPAPGYDPDEPL
jgi:hypothetical protein